MKYPLLQEELFERINWLIKLRWIAVLGVFFALPFVNKVLKVTVPAIPLYVVIVILAIYNLLFSFYAKKILKKKKAEQLPREANRFFNLQISFDLISLAALIHFSGGIENPFIFYFIFHIIIASILLTLRASYLQASLAVFLFGSFVLLEYYGLIPHFCLEGFVKRDLSKDKIYVLGILFSFSTTLYICAWMVTSIAQRLRQKQAEIESTQMRLSRITEGIQEGILLIDRNYKILWANKKQRELFGDIVGDYCYQATHHRESPCQAPDDICPIEEVLKTGKSSTVVHTHFDKSGNKIFVEVGAYPIKDKTGEPVQFVHISRDITERIKKEEELKEAYNKLRESQAQLVQSSKMASVGQLAGGIAHEINNPLTGVLNHVQLIKMMIGQKKLSFEKFKDILDAVEESALRCSKITRSLLDFSRPSGGVFQIVSFNDIIDKVLNLTADEIKLEKITLKKYLQPDMPQVLGDPQLLQQVVFDVISNARWAIQKKSKVKGGFITIKTEYKPEDNTVYAYISDTGTGISKENLTRIFEPFFTTKPVGEGVGLGLYIVYNIIKAHKGNIEVESELNQGATFKISLPLS